MILLLAHQIFSGAANPRFLKLPHLATAFIKAFTIPENSYKNRSEYLNQKGRMSKCCCIAQGLDLLECSDSELNSQN
jgi:hypothetical protein